MTARITSSIGQSGMDRGQFLCQTAAGIGAAALYAALGSGALAATLEKTTAVRRLRKPLAIAMWDFCWLARRYPDGGYEDWDRALDELADRGYNALRLDVFPQMVSLAERDPNRRQITFAGASAGSHMLWGNDVPVTVDARAALIDFLLRCRKRGLKLSFSTWFRIPADPAIPRVEGFDHFVQVWDDTLRFLGAHDLLRDALFIDLANEFPFYSGFKWLRSEAEKAAKQTSRDAPAGQENLQDIRREGNLSAIERSMYLDFSRRVLGHFHARYPRCDFTLSHAVNMDGFHPELYSDVGAMDALDTHIWLGHHPLLAPYNMGNAQHMTPAELAHRYAELKQVWAANRDRLIGWMDERLAGYSTLAARVGAVPGNTEGWGEVGWDDIPPLDWAFIKEAGDLGADLAKKHGYKFICTSNFTHPHFKRLWADVKWHQSVTTHIRA